MKKINWRMPDGAVIIKDITLEFSINLCKYLKMSCHFHFA